MVDINVYGAAMMKKLILSMAGILALSATGNAGYREDFEKEFLLKTWAGDQTAESSCIGCHSSIPSAEDNAVVNWRKTVHYEYNVSCQDCHGGDPKDASMAMSHERGYIGLPKAADVPEFCGRCHVRILKNYLESGHGKAPRTAGKVPDCVTCHGSHSKGRYTQKASINIINEQLCSQCHPYERAKTMKQALFLVEQKIQEMDAQIETLKKEGVFTEVEDKILFNIHAEYRALWHTTDMSLVMNSSDAYMQRLNALEQKVRDIFSQLRFRRNYAAFLMLLFAGMGIIVFINSKTPRE